MAMILDAFMSKFSTLLTDFVQDEVIMLLGVKDELQMLRKRMRSIQCLLKDAEKKKFNESSTELWLSELKDVMYDAEDIIDLCRIEGTQLLTDQNPKSKSSSVCCNFSSVFSCFTSVPLRHEIGNRIKDINKRLKEIYEDRERYKLEKSTISETPQITLVDSRQTSSMIDPFVVGREVEVAANSLVDHLIQEKVDEKCRLFAIVGMGGIGKTTLAQKIFNHPKIQAYFNSKVWVCVSQTYAETELLKQVIRGAKRDCRDVNTKSELQHILSDSVSLDQSLFLVLDDVWRADVWVDLLRVPLYNSNKSVRVLVTTRYENVAMDMKAAYIHPVAHLSEDSCWDMLRRRLFSEGQEEVENGLKELGFVIVKRCRGLPLAVKAIAGVLSSKPRTKKVWKNFLNNTAWSIQTLPEEISGALYLSFEDLPSHLKQCFLYFSLFPEDAWLYPHELAQLWVAEGFIIEQQDSLMEDLAEECFDELHNRNLLLPKEGFSKCKMHDLIRSLAIFLSKEEASFGDLNVRNSITSTKLRRLSVIEKEGAVEIVNYVADQGTLRTLLASYSDLLLDDEILRRLSHLRVLDISCTQIQILPDSIRKLVHLRYLNLKMTEIREIPKSIEQLTNLQFLDLSSCRNLRQLPSGITGLYSLRHLDILASPISFIPKGIEKLQQLNYLGNFVVANNDSSSKLEDLNSLKQIRTLIISNLKRLQSETIILKELLYLSTLKLQFFIYEFYYVEEEMAISKENELAVSEEDDPTREEKELAVEELFDRIIPPQSLENFTIDGFFGRRFPNWMVSSSFELCVPNLTKLVFHNIESCTQLPSLGQLPELRELVIDGAKKVKKLGPEIFGIDVNSTRIAFPKLERLEISSCRELEEWSFGAQVEKNASPRLKLLPCLRELEIFFCPSLKQLSKGLKYSNMKILKISSAYSLKLVDNLPAEVEELRLIDCKNLEKVYCAPTLKMLEVQECGALACMEKLDSLQKLYFSDTFKANLPEWILKTLQQRALQNDYNDDFQLELDISLINGYYGLKKKAKLQE
ncbi:Putative disease resistance protein RGA4 [Dendrobium catenatum]|uniref:Disease resistance protein RGA4 n=1 Tax=Dendrobium catenatum TaxID=906689 RepID=A0A2I0X704_9ASPA|nr:Putative disease resistance protein RGA4 [Dendrobium catenatum]